MRQACPHIEILPVSIWVNLVKFALGIQIRLEIRLNKTRSGHKVATRTQGETNQKIQIFKILLSYGDYLGHNCRLHGQFSDDIDARIDECRIVETFRSEAGAELCRELFGLVYEDPKQLTTDTVNAVADALKLHIKYLKFEITWYAERNSVAHPKLGKCGKWKRWRLLK